MGLLFSYISFAQIEKSASTQQMSNYEKYILAKEKATVTQDTIYKDDTVFVGQEKREWDDLYYTSSKDELKRKAKYLRLRKREIRMKQDSLYYDAKKEVYEDFSFTAQIYRFHRPYYGFGYYSYYCDPFYDPWFLDSWYYGGNSYYGYGFDYPYYHSYWGFGFGYYNWYGWDYPYHSNYYFKHSHYGNNYYNNNYYGYSNHHSAIQYGRRERPSNLTSNYTTTRRQPVTINRTVKIDRSTGRTSIIQENRRTATTARTNNNLQKINSPQERRVTGGNSRNQSYTPSYTQPRMSTRPQYNNTNPNRSYTAPIERRTAPSRSYNSGSGSSRSYNSGSSFSGGSRSSGSSYSRGSSGSGGSSSRSGSSGSSSGRR